MSVIDPQYAWKGLAAKVPTLGATRVAALGDSITFGNNSTPITKSAGFRYVFWAAGVAAGKTPQMVGSVSQSDGTWAAPYCFGFPGSTIEGSITTAIGTLGNTGQPSVVLVINNGTNNISTGDSAATTATKLDTMLQAARLAAPGAVFIVSSMLPRNDSFEAVSVAYSALIPAVCSNRGCLFLDMRPLVDPSLIEVAGVHPKDDQAYQIMGAATWAAAAPYVNAWH